MDKVKLLKIGGALAALGILGALVVVSGIVPISARQGHWPVTAWFLHFAMERSVATHSLGTKVPPLADRSLIVRGAGHYESGCRPCHGGPLPRKPVIPMSMTPHPPDLANAVPHWKDRELFYLVRHGVKMTGMPAWPARHRDDEVWAVVAFLRVLPSLSPEGYDELVFGGTGSGGAAGGGAELLRSRRLGELLERGVTEPGAAQEGAVEAGGERSRGGTGSARVGEAGGGQAAAVAAGAGSGDDAAIATEPVGAGEGGAAGAPAAAAVQPSPGLDLSPVPVAAGCVRCHGDDGLGRGVGAFPRLAGQSETYLLESLRAYAAAERASGIMQPLAAGLSDRMMQRLAAHYAAQPPGGPALEPLAAVYPGQRGEEDPDLELEPGQAPPPDLGSVSHQGAPPWTLSPPDAEALERGRSIAHDGVPERGIPSCVDCHGPREGERNPHYPSLAGQHPGYLVQQLELFEAGHRGGTEYSHLMHEIAPSLSRQQMEDVVRWYGSLEGEARDGAAAPTTGQP